MALIYAWGPLSGLHINPAVTLAFAARGTFRTGVGAALLVAQLAGAVGAALFLQLMFGHVAAGGNYPVATPGGTWRSFVMETVLTAVLVSVILNTATGYRSIGHNAALAVGATVALLGLFASPISGASMNPARTLGPGHRGQQLRRLVGLPPRARAGGPAGRGPDLAGARPARQQGARGGRRRRPAPVNRATRAYRWSCCAATAVSRRPVVSGAATVEG